jgi:hypothetical protein
MEEMERVRRCKRPCQLGIERAPARQPDDVGEPAEAGVSAAGNGCWIPPPAHELTLRRHPDAADDSPVRVLLILLIPVMLFSAWQFTRREENENRLALVASAVASRDVEVSCPGVLARLVEITPNSGWVDFDQDGKPGDTTILSASTCRGLERVWRGDEKSFACLLGGGCDENTMGAVYGIVTLAHESWHLRGVTGGDAVLRDPDGRAGRAPAGRQLAERAPDRALGCARQCRRTGGRVPLAGVSSRRQVRPPPRDARLAERLVDALDEDAGARVGR